MDRRITWKKPLHAQGRNGLVKCRGIQLFEMRGTNSGKFVQIMPINSRGSTSNCWIEIARDSIPDIIEFLSMSYYGRETFFERTENE